MRAYAITASNLLEGLATLKLHPGTKLILSILRWQQRKTRTLRKLGAQGNAPRVFSAGVCALRPYVTLNVERADRSLLASMRYLESTLGQVLSIVGSIQSDAVWPCSAHLMSSSNIETIFCKFQSQLTTFLCAPHNLNSPAFVPQGKRPHRSGSALELDLHFCCQQVVEWKR
jgi:hypothetical protein